MEKFAKYVGRGFLHLVKDLFVAVVCIGIEDSAVGMTGGEHDLPLVEVVRHARCEVVTPGMKHDKSALPVFLCVVGL